MTRGIENTQVNGSTGNLKTGYNLFVLFLRTFFNEEQQVVSVKEDRMVLYWVRVVIF